MGDLIGFTRPPDAAGGHGVHVAGIIAALDNSIDYIGIAPNPAGFAGIKVCNAADDCEPEWVAAGLDWAISQSTACPRQIVNMSFGACANSTLISQAVATAANAGILLIASAGNHQTGATEAEACGNYENDLGSDWPTGVLFSARYSQVMAVSGTLEDDAFAVAPPNPGPYPPSGLPGGRGGGHYACAVPDWCFIGSRSGAQVAIAAAFYAISPIADGSTKSLCGTSMSAPYVTGVAALVWSYSPGMTAAAVRNRLQSTAVPYYPAPEYGSGRVNAVYAVYNLLPPSPPPSVSVTITGPNLTPARRHCTWAAGAYGGTEPYTYSWTVKGAPAGDGSETVSMTTPSTNFTITATAIDASGYTGISGMTVTVGGTGGCADQ